MQSIFEYQSLICQLTDMEVANASLYDGGSALAEACSVAATATRRRKIIVPDTVNPAYQRVLETYARTDTFVPQTVATDDGLAADQLLAAIDDETAAVVLQHPNFLGILETNAADIAERVHQHKGLLIMVVDPISLGLLLPPGKLGADLVVGEGQSLGMPLSFGGPYLGFLAATKKLMRRVPGRLVGQTVDAEGVRAFVLTLQAREQHIRREKLHPTSAQSGSQRASGHHLSGLGWPRGLRDIALRSHQLAVYAAEQLAANGIPLLHQQPYFKEFAVQLPQPHLANQRLLEQGIIGGYELPEGMLLAFTEKRTKAEIDQLVNILGGMTNEQ